MGNVVAFPGSKVLSKGQIHAARRARVRTRQLEVWDQIRALPHEDQAQALYNAWPRKLPKLVRARITTHLRQAWRKIRADEVMAEEAAYVKALGEQLGHPLALDQYLELLPEDRLLDSRIAWGEVADEILATLASCPNIQGMVITWLDQSFALNGAADGLMDDQPLRDFVCLMIGSSGSIMLREALPMKIQVGDPQANVWLNQSRVYGFFVGHGGWAPQSAQVMRECYGLDPVTGKVVPDPLTLMGDAHDLVKRAGVRVTPPQGS